MGVFHVIFLFFMPTVIEKKIYRFMLSINL